MEDQFDEVKSIGDLQPDQDSPDQSPGLQELLLASPDALNRTDALEDQIVEDQSPIKARQLLQSNNEKKNEQGNENEGENNTTYPMAESIYVKGQAESEILTPQQPALDQQHSMAIQNRAQLDMQETMIAQEEHFVKEKVEDENLMDENFFYPVDYQDIEVLDSPIPSGCLRFSNTFGYDSYKRYNLWLIDDYTLLYGAGISYHFYNMETREDRIFFSRDGGGIGSLSIHSSKRYYAVAEKGSSPNVYIYTYPDHKLYRILRKGTERSYSSCTFSQDGDMLATVGSSPDYLISIWNWKQENILLKAKAFAQEVYRVQFSQHNTNFLGTAGMGHIKFWKVAETFTGLKLKGEIAKFGQVELSDVYAFTQFADGKVLSGTEYGRLILWEGNVIKCVIGINDVVPAHNGAIEVIFQEGDLIISAGNDGCIKMWKFSDIEVAEGDDQQNYFIDPVKSILIQDPSGNPANILTIQRAQKYWIVGDANGNIWRLDLPDFEPVTQVISSNSGKIFDLAISTTQNIAVTVGQDGYTRLWDYVNNRLFLERQFPSMATSVEWLPYNKNNKGRVIVVGFSNGVVRVLLFEQTRIVLLKAIKVHSQPIQLLKCSPDGRMVAVLSKAGELFLLKTSLDVSELEPYCLFETGYQVSDMTWDHKTNGGEKILIGTKDGKVLEVLIPATVDNSSTYLVKFEPRIWNMRMMDSQKPKKEEMDLEFLLRRNKDEKIPEVEWDPAPIMNVGYYDKDCTKVIVTAEGKFMGNLYIIDWSKDRPIEAISLPKVPTQFMQMDIKTNMLLMGFKNGSYQIRHQNDFKLYNTRDSHDIDYGGVRKVVVNFDKTAILSVAEDGTFYVYSLDYNAVVQSARGLLIEAFDHPQLQYGMTSGSFSEEIIIRQPTESDIINDKIYSIQEAKLLAEEDQKKLTADKRKQIVLSQVLALRDQFESVLNQNKMSDEMSKLNQEELCVDPEFIKMLHNRVKDDTEETSRELKWDQYYAKLMTDKLKKYMKDELEVDRFNLRGIKLTKLNVSTFKVKKLSQYVQEQLAEIYRLIEDERFNQQEKEQEQKNENHQAQYDTVAGTLGGTAVGASQLLNKTNLQNTQVAVGASATQEFNEGQQEDKSKKSSAKAERERQKAEEEKIRREQEDLEKTKPTKESFEPDHLRDIQEATETLGDYKLKSSSNYVVPENLRMNVSKKRKHMFLLEEFLHNTKLKFNMQLIQLRQKKIELIQKIKEYNKNITKINVQLNKNEDLFSPEIDKELEDPDSFMTINDEQIDQWAQTKLKDSMKRQGGMTSMGGGGAAPVVEEKKVAVSASVQQVVETKEVVIKLRKGIRVQTSQLESEMTIIQEMILLAEKNRMLEEIEEEMSQFDNDLLKCKSEKNVLESDMTISKMKLITFYQELLILDDMEEFDNKLIKELLDFKREKQGLDDQGYKIVDSLFNLAKRESQNEKEFNDQMKAFKELVYPDDEGKREKIHQHYLRKFKKDQAKKVKVSSNDDDADEDDDDDDGSEEEEEEEEEEDYADDDDEKPDLSSVENDPKIKDIIDKICELETQQENNKREKIDFDRQKTTITNKTATVQKELRRAEDDLRAFQRKKLQKVNQLDVSFMLKFSQVQNLIEQGESYKLPIDLNVSILFTDQEFYRLCRRIREIQQEQKKIERQKKLKEKTKKVLEKEIALKDSKINDLNKKYEEKHMLKFGDIIDLKILDALEPTKQVLEQRDVFKYEEKETIKKVEEAKRNLQVYKHKLLEAKKDNTKIINNITKLGKQQMDLSKKLDSTNKQLFKEENEERRSDLEREKQNLKDLVKFLSKEIEDLKTEIGLFKRKGGHIYTMVTSTKKQIN